MKLTHVPSYGSPHWRGIDLCGSVQHAYRYQWWLPSFSGFIPEYKEGYFGAVGLIWEVKHRG